MKTNKDYSTNRVLEWCYAVWVVIMLLLSWLITKT
jgi:hypothetical protein